MPADLDDLRAARPGWGFAVYAFEAGQPVTLEAHAPTGDIFTFTGATVAEAVGRAMPDDWRNREEASRETVFD